MKRPQANTFSGTLNSGDDAIDPALLTIGVSNGAPPGNHVPSNGPATAEPQGTATIINPNGIHLVPAQGTFLRLDLQPEDFSVGSIHRSTAQPDLILPQQNAALQPTNGAPGGSEDEEEPSTFLVHAGIPVGFYQSFANEAEQALANLLRNYPHLASNIPPPDLDNVDLVEVGANTLGIGQPGAMPGLFGRDDPTHPARFVIDMVLYQTLANHLIGGSISFPASLAQIAVNALPEELQLQALQLQPQHPLNSRFLHQRLFSSRLLPQRSLTSRLLPQCQLRRMLLAHLLYPLLPRLRHQRLWFPPATDRPRPKMRPLGPIN